MNTIFVHRNGRTEPVDQHRSELARVRRSRDAVSVGRSRRAVDSRIAGAQRQLRLSSAGGRGRAGADASRRRSTRTTATSSPAVAGAGRRHRLLRRPALHRQRPRRRVEGDRRPDRQRPATSGRQFDEGPVRDVPPAGRRAWSTGFERRSIADARRRRRRRRCEKRAARRRPPSDVVRESSSEQRRVTTVRDVYDNASARRGRTAVGAPRERATSIVEISDEMAHPLPATSATSP